MENDEIKLNLKVDTKSSLDNKENPQKIKGDIVMLYILFFGFSIGIILILLKFNLSIALGIIFLGNSFILLISQIIHHFLGNTEHYKKEWKDIVRSIAGILEMLLFSFSFAIGSIEIIVGYLLLKSLSVWKSDNQIKEGRSTAVLRIAIILSILISFIPSYYLFNFLHPNIHKDLFGFIELIGKFSSL